jgi:hypothetical protein
MKQLKNPLVLGLAAAVLTYAYLWHCRSVKAKEYAVKLQAAFEQGVINQDQVNEQMAMAMNEPINWMYPVGAGAVVWFASCMYFKRSGARSSMSGPGSASSDLMTRISEDITLEPIGPGNTNNFLWR